MKHCNNYWTKDKCQLVALKYSNRNSFRNNDASAYRTAIAKKWLDEICLHMPNFRNQDWTKEKCQEEALKHDKITKFSKIGGAYHASNKNKWLDEICSHMKYRK